VRRLACLVSALLAVVCSPVGPDPVDPGPDPADAPRLATVLPHAAELQVAAGDPIEFRVEATSPRRKPLVVTFLVDGSARTSATTFVFAPPAAGTYRVTAVVSDGELETTHAWTVTVDPPPNATPTVVLSIEPASGRAPLPIRARVQGADPDGRVVRFRLELAGPNPLALERATAIDTILSLAAGSWQATGTVEDDRGATAALTRAIDVAPANLPPLPRLQADPRAGPAPLDVLVEAGGSDPDGQVVAYRLDLDGDGSFEVESPAPIRRLVRYEAPGDYRVLLSLVDDAGAEARDSLAIGVSEPPPAPPPPPANATPVVDLVVSPGEGEAPLDVEARVSAVDPDGTVAEIRVDFDDDGQADAAGPGPELHAGFRYPAPGDYTVRATAVDDDGAAGRAVATVTVLGSPNEPPTGALAADVTRGDAPLEVRLSATAADPDGRIDRAELDADQGAGFVALEAPGSRTVVYGFREAPYRPRLRLTDDAGVSVVIDGPEIRVHRPVAGGVASVAGNPRFDPTAIAPAVWSDGEDEWRFEVTVRGHAGEPLSGVPLRVSATRGELSAPDGTSLGPAVTVLSPAPTTGSGGVATGALVTLLSTRIERAPEIAFQPFSLLFEADAGQGEWRMVARVDGLNANTVVSGPASRLLVFPPNQAVCPGTPIEFEVQARTIADAPRPGAATGRYAELRYTDGRLLAADPNPGWSAWKTDAAGVIRFSYVPARADQSRLVEAWVDGQPVGELGLIALRPSSECDS
jgi:PKD repeat protein